MLYLIYREINVHVYSALRFVSCGEQRASERGCQEHPSFLLCFWFVLLPSILSIHFLIHSFIHQCYFFFFFRLSLLSFRSSHGPKGWVERGGGLCEKERISPRFFLFLSFTSLESLFPHFIPAGPLSSLVECPTLWCVLGTGRRGLWLEGERRYMRGCAYV